MLLATCNTKGSRITYVRSKMNCWTCLTLLRRREAEVHVHIPERHPEARPQIIPRVLEDVPPPVPLKDRPVGPSRSVSPTPSPAGPREIEMDRPSPVTNVLTNFQCWTIVVVFTSLGRRSLLLYRNRAICGSGADGGGTSRTITNP